MPVKRRPAKERVHRITAEAVEAFVAGDWSRLHRALGLGPHEISPLPLSVTPLGCNQGPGPRPNGTAWNDSWDQAAELQRQLMKAANGRGPKCP